MNCPYYLPMSVIHETGPCVTPPAEPALTFSYEPDHFQNHSFNAMDRGDHVLVTAHTGSGKTTVAEYAVAHGMRCGKRVIYTSPIKALSNQIFGDFNRKYPHWSLGIRTGDIDFRSDDAQIIIMTTEILQNMLYRQASELKAKDDSSLPTVDFNDVAVVIFDEVHYIKDRDRGSVWERSIMMMPEHIQMIMLSATLPDADQFCKWIVTCKGGKRNVTHTTTPFRAVPLTHFIMTDRDMAVIMDKDGNFNDDVYRLAMNRYTFVPSDLDRYIGRMKLPALFFCFSKKHCQTYACGITCNVTTSEERQVIQHKLDNLIRKFSNHKELMTLDQTQEVFRLAVKGICYHHAGLLPPLKEIIQELFSAGLIKVLFVTETFAAGVNMPAKTVVFTGLTKYDNHADSGGNAGSGGFRILLPEEYGQMAGRAGRRGMDTEGVVIHLPFNVTHHPDKDAIRTMMCGKIRDIESRIRPDYHHIFNSILFETDVLSGGSMQDRDRKATLEHCTTNLETVEKQLASTMVELEVFENSNDLNDEFYENIQFYQRFHRGELKGKSAKTYHKSGTEQWYECNRDMCDQLMALETRIGDLESQIDRLQCEIEVLEHGSVDDLSMVTDFLSANGYLRVAKELSDYVPDDLTAKGVMAASINEANCLLLTQLIVEDYLEDLDCFELSAVLALFLATKETDRVLNLPKKICDRLARISIYAEEWAVAESKYSPCISDWEVHREFCDMAYWWTKSGNVGRVYTETCSDVQVGEFARMMIKLNNVCREALKAAQISQKDDLCMRLRECQTKLIQGVVFPQSMYVSPGGSGK
jgi:superfamily II RNA helicase